MQKLAPFLILIFFVGCKPLQQSGNQSTKQAFVSPIKKMYDELLPEDEVKIRSDYTSMISKNANGKFIKRMYYPDSKTLIEYGEYHDQNLFFQHGPSKSWSDYGVLTNECMYDEGKKVGLEQNFHYKTGEPSYIGSWTNGEKQGTWKYYKEGKLHKEINFNKNQKEGNYSVYNPEGELVTNGVYKQDSLVETNILIEDDWGKLKSAPGKDGKIPLFGDGCPEQDTYEKRKRCSEEKMLRFIYSNLRYPSLARERGLEGMAIAQYTIDKDGSVIDVDVIKGLSEAIRTEVTRVVNMMPKWVPGEMEGVPAKVLYTLPIKFRLE